MKAILLDGSLVSNAVSDRISKAAIQSLNNLGYQVERILLREKTIGNCAGDFFCWVRTPGICNVKDDNIAIAESIMDSKLVAYLTPVTFGGYSSTLKKLVDHQIQNISPYFAVVEGETHHQKRYKDYPDFAVIGYTDKNDLTEESVFKQLVHRNSINFFAKNNVCEVIHSNQNEDQISNAIKNCLNNLNTGFKQLTETSPVNQQNRFPPINAQRAVLLVGSPRTQKSTSYSLGEYLFQNLNNSHITTDVIHLHTILRSPEKIGAMLESLDSANLITLAFPLYVDSLPAPVIKALETIAAHREKNPNSRPQLFTAIVNCGFPEASHNATAQSICEIFARQTGFVWGGSLSLGGGGMVDGTSLSQLGGRTFSIRKSLDLSAEALIQGKPIPLNAQILMSKPVIPAWLYRLFGGWGWKQQAKKYQTQNQLKHKPYQSLSSQE